MAFSGLVAVAASAAESAAAAAAAGGLRARLVDGQRAAAVLLAGEGGHRLVRLAVIVELDEAESLRPAGIAVGDHGDGVDVAVLREERSEIVLRGVVGQIANIKFHDTEIPSERELQKKGG